MLSVVPTSRPMTIHRVVLQPAAAGISQCSEAPSTRHSASSTPWAATTGHRMGITSLRQKRSLLSSPSIFHPVE